MDPESIREDGVRRLDEPLLRSLHALLAEVSVSRAASKLGIAQSPMSRHLSALRSLTGDELLVRVGNRMVLTERAISLAAPTRRILADMSQLTAQAGPLSLADLRLTFRLATYDFLPRRFFGQLVERLSAQAPECDLVIQGLGTRFEHYRQLADGELDLVITVWPELPAHLRATSLLTEPIACLMRSDHPLAQGEMDLQAFQRARHLASLEHVPGHGTVIDTQLADIGASIRTAVHTQYLGLAPAMLAGTDLIFTTGRLLAEDLAQSHPNLVVVPFPAAIKPLRYRLLWHERTHSNRAMRWLREEIVTLARASATRPRA